MHPCSRACWCATWVCLCVHEHILLLVTYYLLQRVSGRTGVAGRANARFGHAVLLLVLGVAEVADLEQRAAAAVQQRVLLRPSSVTKTVSGDSSEVAHPEHSHSQHQQCPAEVLRRITHVLTHWEAGCEGRCCDVAHQLDVARDHAHAVQVVQRDHQLLEEPARLVLLRPAPAQTRSAQSPPSAAISSLSQTLLPACRVSYTTPGNPRVRACAKSRPPMPEP